MSVVGLFIAVLWSAAGDASRIQARRSEITERSVYQLDATWTDQNGAQRRLADWLGKKLVVSMIFTHCEYTCPRIVAGLRALEDAMDQEQKQAVQFVLISFDSERDNPAVLKAFAVERGLQSRSWIFLHGEADNIQELAAVLDIQYKKDEKIGFVHANVVAVLNRRGEIVYRHNGVPPDVEKIRAALTTSE